MSGRAETTSTIKGRHAVSVGLTDMPAPKGWKWTKLLDVARLESGHTPSRKHPEYWDGDIKWIGIKDARAHHCKEIKTTLQKITQAGLDNSAARLLPPKTVCLSRTASVGYVFVLGEEMATSQDFVNWVCTDAIYPKFLMYALVAEGDGIRDFGKGTTHTTIYYPEVKAFHVCLPPLPEQRRIVSKIEELFSKLDAGVAALKQTKAQLKRYRQSVLAAAVTGELNGAQPTPQKTWKPIGNAIKNLDQGWSPRCERFPSESDDKWAVIKTTAIQAGYFLSEENKQLPEALEPRPKIELKADDVLITRAGPRKRVGVACHIKATRSKLMLCDKAYRVKTNTSVSTPAFLQLVLNAPQIVDALDELKSGISDSGLNLTQTKFKELRIPLPSLDEQKQIIAEVEARTTSIDHIETELDQQLTRANRLRQSILSSAFSGQL